MESNNWESEFDKYCSRTATNLGDNLRDWFLEFLRTEIEKATMEGRIDGAKAGEKLDKELIEKARESGYKEGFKTAEKQLTEHYEDGQG